MISSISPSVVVPTTLSLERKGYGKGSGINTLIVGAASMDVVISISLFGVFLGLAFSEGKIDVMMYSYCMTEGLYDFGITNLI